MPAVAKLNAQMVGLLSTVFERCWACGVKTWDPPNMADGGITSTTVTVTGARVGDPCAQPGLSTLLIIDAMIFAHVQAPDTVRVTLYNRTGGALNIASGTLTVCVRVRYAI